MKISEYKVGVTVRDYVLSAEYGTIDAGSKFEPFFSPMEMLKLGVFEGKYINDSRNEFPEEWYIDAKISKTPNILCNYFKVKSRQSLHDWKTNGWIYGRDKRGWFQWYCRYYIGRRIPEIDDIQMKRWRQFKRHYGQVLKNCPAGDLTCRPKQRQALLQWSYNAFI